jgi:hypothetical protein
MRHSRPSRLRGIIYRRSIYRRFTYRRSIYRLPHRPEGIAGALPGRERLRVVGEAEAVRLTALGCAGHRPPIERKAS